MKVRWPLNRAETLAVAALVVTALGAIPNWVNLVQARGYDAAWLIPALQWVQSARWVIVGLVACAVAVLLVWKFWPLLVRLFKWLGGLPKRFYLWLLWRLAVRPARDAFGLEAHEEADAITPAFADLLRDRLRALDADSLWVLEGALARRKPGSNEAVLEYPVGMRLEPRESGAGMAKPRFEKALDSLKNVGAISSWEPVGREHPRNFSIRVLLPTSDWRTLDRLRVLAEVEWARRSLRAEMLDQQTHPEKPAGTPPAGLEYVSLRDLHILRRLVDDAVRNRSLEVHVRWLLDRQSSPPAAWPIEGPDPLFDEVKEIAMAEFVTLQCYIEKLRNRRELVMHVRFLDTDLDALSRLKSGVQRELERRGAGES